jgi:hypothetical protein
MLPRLISLFFTAVIPTESKGEWRNPFPKVVLLGMTTTQQ